MLSTHNIMLCINRVFSIPTLKYAVKYHNWLMQLKTYLYAEDLWECNGVDSNSRRRQHQTFSRSMLSWRSSSSRSHWVLNFLIQSPQLGQSHSTEKKDKLVTLLPKYLSVLTSFWPDLGNDHLFGWYQQPLRPHQAPS